MKKTSALVGIAFALWLASCGNDSSTEPVSSSVHGLGNFDFSCGANSSSGGGYGSGSGGGYSGQKQQQQVQFQQQRSCNQKFEFRDHVSDFDVDLDCDRHQVVVRNQGLDRQNQTMRISDDGKIGGKMRFQQQMKSDGRSGQVCWVQFEVVFNGHAVCPGDGDHRRQSLTLDTQVGMTRTTTANLAAAGIPISEPYTSQVNPSPSPSDSRSASPSPSSSNSESGETPTEPGVNASESPTPSPISTGSPSPSPSPSSSTSASPSPTPSPSIIPVVVCVVEDSCPVEAKTDMSCDGDNHGSYP